MGIYAIKCVHEDIKGMPSSLQIRMTDARIINSHETRKFSRQLQMLVIVAWRVLLFARAYAHKQPEKRGTGIHLPETSQLSWGGLDSIGIPLRRTNVVAALLGRAHGVRALMAQLCQRNKKRSLQRFLSNAIAKKMQLALMQGSLEFG